MAGDRHYLAFRHPGPSQVRCEGVPQVVQREALPLVSAVLNAGQLAGLPDAVPDVALQGISPCM